MQGEDDDKLKWKLRDGTINIALSSNQENGKFCKLRFKKKKMHLVTRVVHEILIQAHILCNAHIHRLS